MVEASRFWQRTLCFLDQVYFHLLVMALLVSGRMVPMPTICHADIYIATLLATLHRLSSGLMNERLVTMETISGGLADRHWMLGVWLTHTWHWSVRIQWCNYPKSLPKVSLAHNIQTVSVITLGGKTTNLHSATRGSCGGGGGTFDNFIVKTVHSASAFWRFYVIREWFILYFCHLIQFAGGFWWILIGITDCMRYIYITLTLWNPQFKSLVEIYIQ